MDSIPKPYRTWITGAAVVLGGIATLNAASTLTFKALHVVAENKRKKIALPCMVCRGKGFYICRLCNGNSTIAWSPMYDPIAINPCVCPTCDGNRVQHCLNCLGKDTQKEDVIMERLRSLNTSKMEKDRVSNMYLVYLKPGCPISAMSLEWTDTFYKRGGNLAESFFGKGGRIDRVDGA